MHSEIGRAEVVDLLVKKRKAAGLTQIDIAKRIRQSQSWLAYLESGRRHIDVAEFFMLANAIGFDPHRALREAAIRHDIGHVRARKRKAA